MRSKRQAASGKRGENRVALELRRAGFLMVERIGTPVRLLAHPTLRGFFRVVFGEKVAGDFRAMLPGGRSVLVECKTTTGNEGLGFAQFEPHQLSKLSEHHENGGVSLVVWVRSIEDRIYIMRWPFPCEFKPHQAIKPEYAAGLDDAFWATVFVD